MLKTLYLTKRVGLLGVKKTYLLKNKTLKTLKSQAKSEFN